MKSIQYFLSFVLITLSAWACQPHSESVSADLIITNAVIWTGNKAQPKAEALAISSDTILAIGSEKDILTYQSSTTQMIDAGQQFIVPGFIDCHVHFLTGGFRLSSVQLRDAATPTEFIKRIAEFAAELEPGDWITGGDWDHENWGGELPHKEWIDSVTMNNPVFINRLDGHMALANSAAMKIATITEDVKDVAGGTIVRTNRGVPTGIFKDNAMSLVERHVSTPTARQKDRALQSAMNYVAAQGVTSVHSVGDGLGEMAVFERARDKNELITRIYALMPLSRWPVLEEKIKKEGKGDKWLSIGGLKGFVDGSLGSHTAAFHDPFTDVPEDRGFFVNPEDSLYNWVSGADQAGLQVAIHAIGDRANHTLLNIFERVKKENGPRDRRFRIEHAQHIAPNDISRFASLGVIPSMQPYHTIDDGRWAEKVIGPERIKTTYAFKSLLAADARLAFGSDWFVAPPTPLEGIYAAVTRRTLDGATPNGWVPEQKISVEEALQAYTLSAAYASFEEDRKGSLIPGKLADFVMLGKDLRAIPPKDIREVQVKMTVVGGKVVFRHEAKH